MRPFRDKRFLYGYAAWLVAYLLGVFAGHTDWPWWAFLLFSIACALIFFQLLERREKVDQ